MYGLIKNAADERLPLSTYFVLTDQDFDNGYVDVLQYAASLDAGFRERYTGNGVTIHNLSYELMFKNEDISATAFNGAQWDAQTTALGLLHKDGKLLDQVPTGVYQTATQDIQPIANCIYPYESEWLHLDYHSHPRWEVANGLTIIPDNSTTIQYPITPTVGGVWSDTTTVPGSLQGFLGGPGEVLWASQLENPSQYLYRTREINSQERRQIFYTHNVEIDKVYSAEPTTDNAIYRPTDHLAMAFLSSPSYGQSGGPQTVKTAQFITVNIIYD